ncbi:MAG: methionyl-tRNA formyltransferase [Kiritimatiellae bacterium]|nr:methionyl-tRNA formyltransferase [Kiritimatiellia bacterium]MDD5520768.1 methionyl-tRNA formyltransferase [Kiritimatiellia bacterium]
MRIVFMGSADLSCPSLETLLTVDDEVVAVVTQPDRPKGRNLKSSPSPVRVLAESRGISVLTPERINTAESVNALKAFKPDLIVVVAYGQILKRDILQMPPQGCINMHTSLLPKYRGAAPIQWAIANGDKETGVTSMFMNEKMDAGDVVCQKKVLITNNDTGGSLHDKLAGEAAALLRQTVDKIRSGTVSKSPQIETDATFAPKLTKKDGKIDWTSPSDRIYNRIRAFNPWPCCYCEVPAGSGVMLRILQVKVEDTAGSPGQIIDDSGSGPLIACGQGSIRLIQVQPGGRKVMNGADYLRGYRVKVGSILG